MQYELTIVDRIVVGQILGSLKGPGNYLYFKELRKLQEAVAFDEKIAAGIEMKLEGDNVRWSAEKAHLANITVEVGERIQGQIADALKELDKQERLMPEHLSVYEKFVPQEEDDGQV